MFAIILYLYTHLFTKENDGHFASALVVWGEFYRYYSTFKHVKKQLNVLTSAIYQI